MIVTADKNLRRQQNMSGRKLALVVLSTNHWDRIRSSADAVQEVIDRSSAGCFIEVVIGPQTERL